MKTTQLIGIAVIALVFASCKNDKETNAEKAVDDYVAYVDSIKNVTNENIQNNWNEIESQYQIKSSQAQMALADLSDKEKAEIRINESNTKYDDLKTQIVLLSAETNSQKRRDNLFGAGNLNKDMSFAWVNANNILSVYEKFVNTVSDNKDAYSREDWDEIKLMYEALDSRKNTVEKEGLTSKDNLKIAGLKIRFSSIYTSNRMGAKAEENEEAKE